jgi:hypothetical protein
MGLAVKKVLYRRRKAPPNNFEAAILITLGPGNYTTILSGVNGTSGIGLVEVYAQ